MNTDIRLPHAIGYHLVMWSYLIAKETGKLVSLFAREEMEISADSEQHSVSDTQGTCKHQGHALLCLEKSKTCSLSSFLSLNPNISSPGSWYHRQLSMQHSDEIGEKRGRKDNKDSKMEKSNEIYTKGKKSTFTLYFNTSV